MSPTRYRRIAAAALALLALAACKGEQAAAPAGDTDKKGETPSGVVAPKSKVLNIATVGDPETLDVGKMSGVPEGRIAFNAFEGLWMPAQETGPPVYGVAQSHTVSEDRLTWTIQLRKDARWSNGDPVKAEDFVWAWRRVATPGFEADYAEFMDFIAGMEAWRKGGLTDWSQVGVKTEGDHTIIVTLVNPTPFFPELMAFYTFFPVHRPTVEKFAEKWTEPENIVSNGPYMLKEYKLQQHLILERNPHYWDAGAIKIDSIKVHILKDTITQLNAFKEGKLDVVEGGIPVSNVPQWKGKPEFRLDPLLGTYYYRINVKANEALGKKAVRQALALAIDRESLATLTMKGLYGPSKGFVPPMEGHTSTTELNYDPKKARELLAEAGYPEGKGFPETTLLFNTNENHKLIAEIMQDTWKRELGLNIKLENKEWKTYLQAIDDMSYEVARAGWIGDYADPTTFLAIFTTGNGNNDTGWGNPQFDTLIKGAFAERDDAARRKMLEEAEAILMDELPVIPVYFYKNPLLIAARVEGLKPHNRDVHLVKYMDLKP